MSNNENGIINIPNYSSQSVIMTNSITDVERNKFSTLNKENNYYDINKNDENNKTQIQTELSTIIDSSSSNLNEEESLDKELDINQDNNLTYSIIKEEEEKKFSSSLLYGNSINDLKPKHLGNLLAFFYINEKPLILIGPDCKKKIYITNI